MLTDRPNIVVSVSPKKARAKALAVTPKPTAPSIVRKVSTPVHAPAGLSEAERDARADAAEAVWREVSGKV